MLDAIITARFDVTKTSTLWQLREFTWNLKKEMGSARDTVMGFYWFGLEGKRFFWISDESNMQVGFLPNFLEN